MPLPKPNKTSIALSNYERGHLERILRRSIEEYAKDAEMMQEIADAGGSGGELPVITETGAAHLRRQFDQNKKDAQSLLEKVRNADWIILTNDPD